MGTQFNPQNLGILRRTTRLDFYEQLGVAQAEAMYPKLAFDMDSDSDQESMDFFGAIPKPRRTSGGAITDQKSRESIPLRDWSMTVVNARWDTQVPVHRDTMADAKLDQISVRARSMGDSYASWMDERMTEVIEGNNNTYDGAAFFASDHHGSSGSPADKDNDLTDAGPASPGAPTEAEFATAYNTCLTAIKLLTDDQGRIANSGNLGLVCMVPIKYETVARGVLETGPQAGQNFTAIHKGSAAVVANPYLTAANHIFFLFVTSKPIKPIVLSNREELEFKLVAEGDRWEFEHVATMNGTARWEFRMADWKKAVRMTLS